MAAALALVAIMARWPTPVHNRQVRHTVRHHHPAELFADHVARQHAAARKVHGRQKLAVGHLRQALARAAYTDKRFDFFVVRLEILVTERPIFAIAVAAGGLELVVAISVAFARPAEGLAAHLAATYPHKRLVERKGVGILVIVDEKLVAEFVARVTEPLDGLALKQRLAVAEAAKLDLIRSEEHTSELQSRLHLVCRLLLEKKKNKR